MSPLIPIEIEMAKYTLLEVINSYMDATDGWRVATIDDVLESQQVAGIARDVFHEVVNDIFYNSLSTNIVELEALGDSTKPNYLKIPDTVSNIHESKIRYNKYNGTSGSTISYRDVTYLHPQDFLDHVRHRSSAASNTQTVVDFSGVDFVIVNDRHPQYCTSFDQVYLVFDSFNSDVDSTLQKSKSQVLASVQRTFTMSDGYEIDLPEWFHPTYVSLVKARASEYLKGEPLPSDVRNGKIGLIRARNKLRIGNSKFRKKGYGRR